MSDATFGPTSGTTHAAMPTSVDRAQKLVFVQVGLYVVQTVLAFAAGSALVDAYVDGKGSFDPALRDTVRDGAPAYGPIALISLVVFGGLLLLCALNFPKRAGWARIVALVFGVLATLGGLLGFAQPSPLWYKVFVLLGGLVGLGIVVLLAQRESGAWFKGSATGARTGA